MIEMFGLQQIAGIVIGLAGRPGARGDIEQLGDACIEQRFDPMRTLDAWISTATFLAWTRRVEVGSRP